MLQRFYKHICKDENFLYLDGKNVLQQMLSEIKIDFLKEGKENYTVKKQFVSGQRHFPVCLL